MVALPTGPVVAVDMDDVLCQTGAALSDWHNTYHGTSLTVEDAQYFHYWKNEHWGTREEVRKKFDAYHVSDEARNVVPVPYAEEGLRGLKELGFQLKIVTARSHEFEEQTMAWLEKYLPNIFDDVIFTSTYSKMSEEEMKTNPWAGKSKAEVIKAIGGVFLIDDSLENAMICAAEGIHVLLFGDYPWSKRHSGTSTPQDMMSRAERIAAGDAGFWEREVVTTLPTLIRRVNGWKDVVDWVKENLHHLRTAGAPLEELETLGESVSP